MSKIGETLYILVRILIGVAFVAFVLSGFWIDAILTAGIFGLMLVPTILKDRYQVHIPFAFDLAITIFIFLTLFLGSLRGFYERFAWWDGLLHFQSGLLLGVIGFLLVYILNEQRSAKLTMSPGFISFFAFCFSLAVAGVWEIYEFAGDSWFGFNMQESGLPDTMGDMIVNALGALIVSTLGYFWTRHRQKLPFTPFID